MGKKGRVSRSRGKQRPYSKCIVWMVGACLLVLAPSLGYVTIRQVTGRADRVVVEQELYTTDNRLDQIGENLGRTREAIRWLISPEMVGLIGIAAILLIRRGQGRAVIYLSGAALLPWIAILLVSAELTTRYLVLGVPPLLVIVAGALTPPKTGAGLVKQASSAPTKAGWVIIAVWIGLVAGPFDWRAMTDPAGLHLPTRDEYEYITSAASGYGLRDLAADLPHLTPNEKGRIVVIGLLPSCHSLPLYWEKANSVDLKCPLFKWDIREKQELVDRIVGWAEPGSYLAVDEIGDLIDLDALPIRLDLVGEYPRPQDGDTIRLYRVGGLVPGAASSAPTTGGK